MQKRASIQRKLRRVIILTCLAVLLPLCIAFFAYEFITYRDDAKQELMVLGQVISANNTAALAFDDKTGAEESLASLAEQKNIVGAAFFDEHGRLFAAYPNQGAALDLPKQLQPDGQFFAGNFLEGFYPVVQKGTRHGTLYLRANMEPVYKKFILYGLIATIFTGLSLLFAYLLSRRLQRSISVPILQLATTAKKISDHRDYSVRAAQASNDELGTLTGAFNHMLAEIQSRSEEIHALNASLEQKVALRTSELQNTNLVLQQQNEFIQTVIDSSIDLIAVFDRDLRYVMLNKKADQIYSQKRDEMIGKKVLEVFPNLAGSVLIQNLEKALQGEFVHHDAYKSLVSDRYFENFFIPLKDQNEHTDRVLVVGHDITNVMQANAKLKLLNAELEESNRDLEQFAYVASHDLQEPLRKIQTFSELSERNVQHPEILKRYLGKINSSAARMSDLIKAVLNYSRLSRTDTKQVDVNLVLIINNIKTDLELVINEKKATIVASQLPVVRGYPLQLHQLFLNLVSNSLKFCTQPPRIQITSRLVSHEQAKKGAMSIDAGKYVELVFADNGIGFEQQYAGQIFAIFQRLHSGSEYAGTGIGLALCKKIVENHNGAIAVESQPGKGSHFYVYLPVLN